jgi:acetate kinase
MKVLIPNIGSTSLKWRLFEFSDCGERLLHRGGFDRVTDHSAAIDGCLTELRRAGVVDDADDLAAIGFKTIIAKGVTGCVRIDASVLADMEAFAGIAPAHNPPYVAGIHLFANRMPRVPLIALFETAFYQFIPEHAMRYAVPEAWVDLGVRRWGFHGASHKFIAERSADLMGHPDIAARVRDLYAGGAERQVSSGPLRVISCHLGGSSSVTGILDGVAVATSFGMSPQSGLPQNNRVGDLDVSAVPYVMRTLGLSLDDVERQLSRESGLKALSGISNDMRDIERAALEGNTRAALALETYVHAVRHWIGACFAELNGLDALVFTAGIGENSFALREKICQNLEALGVELDRSANTGARAAEARIDAPHSRVQIWVVPTNEEVVVAREARRLLRTSEPRTSEPRTPEHRNLGTPEPIRHFSS